MSKDNVVLTTNKSKTLFHLDGSTLDINVHLVASKTFKSIYTDKLTELFQLDKEEYDISLLMDLLLLVEYSQDNLKPVMIVSSKPIPVVRKIIDVLRPFIKDNYEDLLQIYKMYIGKIDRKTFNGNKGDLA